MHKNEIKLFQQRLIRWYENEFRDLPWRRTGDPYATWVAEVMLQQTQVKKVAPYFERFLRALPTVQELASVDLDVVLKLWEGLGYYARARNLHKAAKIIVEKYNGKFPSRFEQVQGLPGIGAYTAAAIMSIAFDADFPVVDGNVNRVLCRVFRVDKPPGTPAGQKIVQEKANMMLARGRAGLYNQAIMELGAVICTPRSPRCTICPASDFCQAYEAHEQEKYPAKTPPKKRPHKHIAIGIVRKGNDILIDQRKKSDMLGGLWEFPGGQVEAGETHEETVRREIREELALDVKVLDHFATIEHQYSHFSITMHAYFCQYLHGEPQAIECDDWRWVKKEQLQHFAFPRANGKIIEKLMAVL